MASYEENYCASHRTTFPCDLTAFNAAFIGAIAALAGGIMVVCLSLRVCILYLLQSLLALLREEGGGWKKLDGERGKRK